MYNTLCQTRNINQNPRIWMKYSRIPYFSPKVHFYAKQTTESPYNYSETLKTQEYLQNPEFFHQHETSNTTRYTLTQNHPPNIKTSSNQNTY